MKYKLIAFDIDGTILDANFQVCTRLKKIVAQLATKGYSFVLASARFPNSVIEISNQLGVCSEVIALNGGLIINNKYDILFSQDFAIDRIINVLANIDSRIAINYYHKFDWFVTNPSFFTENEIKFVNCVPKITNTIPLDRINKLTLSGAHELLCIVQQQFGENDSILAAFSHPNYLEVTCTSISKLSALEYYAKLKNFTIDEIIAFGDGENDMPMLSGVGMGVAMGNAKDHVKKVAQVVIGNHYEQAVAIYLENQAIKGLL